MKWDKQPQSKNMVIGMDFISQCSASFSSVSVIWQINGTNIMKNDGK